MSCKHCDDFISACFQVPETLPEAVLAKMHAPPKPDVPILDVHDLPNADGIIIGFPTRCVPAYLTNPLKCRFSSTFYSHSTEEIQHTIAQHRNILVTVSLS